MSFAINRISNLSIGSPNYGNNSSELSLNYPCINSKQQLFNLKTMTIHHARKQSYHQKKIILLDSILNIINVFAVTITILKNCKSQQQQINEENRQNYDVEFRYLLVFCLFSGIFNFLKIICQNQLQQQSLQKQQNFIKLFKNWKSICLETVFYLIHPSALAKNITVNFIEPPIPLNKLLSCVIYARLIIILIFLFKLSRFYGLRVDRVLNLYIGDQKNFRMLYTVKCFLKQNGLKSPFLIYGIIIILFPFFIVNLQQKFIVNENQIIGPHSFFEAIYDIVISMATVGYGDMEHNYFFERTLIILAIVIGSLSSSFFTLTFLNWFQLSQQEQKALRSIKRLQIKHEIQQINNNRVNNFVHALIQFKKIKAQEKKNLFNHKRDSKARSQFERNQNLQIISEKQSLSNIIPNVLNPSKKYLQKRLYDTRDTFRDNYDRNHLQLSQSIKLLIQRTLLTKNLLQFYLMRQQRNIPQFIQSSRIVQSSETLKSNRGRAQRVIDDGGKPYRLKIGIVYNKFFQQQQQNLFASQQENQVKKNQNQDQSPPQKFQLHRILSDK